MKAYWAIVDEKGYIITTGNMTWVELEVHRSEEQAIHRLRFHNKPGLRIVKMVEENPMEKKC